MFPHWVAGCTVYRRGSLDDEEVFEVFETIRAESASAEVMDPPPGSSSVLSLGWDWDLLGAG